jgi:negative regulator of replication initiation
MVPTIRVDDEVYERLKNQAEPFIDTPNSVLRRLLELDGPIQEGASTPTLEESNQSRRMRPGELLDRHEYDLLILRVIDRLGGSGYAPDVVEEVGKLVADKLTEMDHIKNKTGVVRWKNRIMWRRFNLVQLGLLKNDSPRGIWEISPAGRRALEKGEIDYGE